MTNVTNGELRIILFGMFFMSVMAVFLSIYNDAPLSETKYGINTSVDAHGNTVNAEDDGSWITGIIKPLPSPFNDAKTVLVFAIVLTPIITMLLPISIRYVKDLVTQWV